MIDFYLLDVKNITSNVPRSNFRETDLENLAEIIIKTGGIIRPIVVKLNGPEAYTVVDGHFEYYAAVRAREKNPREGEMVNAFVISPKAEDLTKRQAEIIRNSNSSQESTQITSIPSNNLESRLANLELRLEKQINELKSEKLQEKQEIDRRFKDLAKQLPQPSDPLNLLNTLDKDQLLLKLQRSRISASEKIAKAIFEARRKKAKQKFEDYRDAIGSVKGLGEKTILTIIDDWSKL